MKKFYLIPIFSIILANFASAADLNQKDFEKAMDSYLKDDANIQKMADSISEYFKKKQMEQAKAANQAEGAKLEEQFKNPVKVDLGSSPSKGPKDAKVTVVAFSDFQCPFCSKGKTIVDELVKKYPKDVKVVFKNLPLDFHPHALPAAKASLAADKQGKFWEMHDYIFDNQKDLQEGEAFFPKAASAIKLDLDKFNKDFKSAEIEAAVKADVDQAKKLGVQGTPNFFVNGVNLKGAYPVEEFSKIIDRWLATK
jgi:protein-disulfide isomerase